MSRQEREESEVRTQQEVNVRAIPKFSSFRPPSSKPDTAADGASGAGEPAQKDLPAIPRFSSFKSPVQPAQPSVATKSSNNRERGEERHRKRRRSRSHSRECHAHKPHKHDRSQDISHGQDEDHRRRDNRDRGGRREADHRRSDRSRERERERHRDREFSRKHRPQEDSDGTRRRKELVKEGGEILPWDDETSTNPAFVINTKGDPDNLVYGTVHRYSIPQYYRAGKGNILGLPRSVRIAQDKGDGKGLVLSTAKDRAEQYKRDSIRGRGYRFAILDNKRPRKLKVIMEGDYGHRAGTEFDRGLAYVPLSTRQRGKGQGQDDVEMFDFNEPAPRLQPEDEDLEYASSSDDEVDEMSTWNSTQIRHKQLEIQRSIDNNLQDVDSWLALVAHQDEVLYPGQGRKKRATLAERKSTAEIKLSIIDKALGKIAPDDREGKERLWGCWFDVAAETWEPSKILSKYRYMLKLNPTMFTIWVKYLNCRQTDFDGFKYPEMVECYEQCLNTLRTAIFNREGRDQDIQRLETIALYVVFRGLCFMREAGYSETSIASLQALLELDLFSPREIVNQLPLSSHDSYDSILDQFQEFWDAEVLRVGEEGAEGWYRYVEKGNEGPVPESLYTTKGGDDVNAELDEDDPFGWWIQKEVGSSARRGCWPARIIDEVEEDDPYNVVLFTDIKRWMFIFSQEDVKGLLINYTLRFCGLPGAFETQKQQDRRANISTKLDTFLMGNEMLSGTWFWPEPDEAKERLITWEGMEPERPGGLMNDAFKFHLSEGYPFTVDMLFGRRDGEWVYPMQEVLGVVNGAAADVHMARRVTRTLIDRNSLPPHEIEKLALFYWALEWRVDPPRAQKMAKKLLKKHRTSLLLYSSYAQIEWRMGNTEAARKIFSTAVGVSGSYPEESRRNAVILWKTWAWEEILDGNYKKALNVLLSMVDGKFIGNVIGEDVSAHKTMLLRARRFLQNEQDKLASLGLIEHALAYNEAMALLEYLSSGTASNASALDVSAALPIYDSLLREMKDKGLSFSAQYEIALLSGKIRLLYHHSRTSKIFRRTLLREALEEAIIETSHTPGRINTVLWSLYAWNEGRARIEGRVRGWLRDRIIGPGGRDATVAGWVFSIWSELRMGGMHVHIVRKLFEDAVECPTTRASIVLWKLYVEFELREKNPIRAKLVLFRALRACPWSKDIAMLAFTKLISALGFDELKQVFSIITSEKELRVYDATELEDLLERMSEENGKALYPGLTTVVEGRRNKMAIQLPEDPPSGSEADE